MQQHSWTCSQAMKVCSLMFRTCHLLQCCNLCNLSSHVLAPNQPPTYLQRLAPNPLQHLHLSQLVKTCSLMSRAGHVQECCSTVAPPCDLSSCALMLTQPAQHRHRSLGCTVW